jgi:hypothetical protein
MFKPSPSTGTGTSSPRRIEARDARRVARLLDRDAIARLEQRSRGDP